MPQWENRPFGFPSGACMLSLGMCYIATGKMYRYLLKRFVQVFTCSWHSCRVFVEKETKASSLVSHCSPSDTISRGPLEYQILIKREDEPFSEELISLKQLRKHWRKDIPTMHLSFINKTLLISRDSHFWGTCLSYWKVISSLEPHLLKSLPLTNS